MKQTRLDIAYTLGILAKHMSNRGEAHIKVLHQLLWYLNGTQDVGLIYVGHKRLEVKGYCDASYNSCNMSEWKEEREECHKLGNYNRGYIVVLEISEKVHRCSKHG